MLIRFELLDDKEQAYFASGLDGPDRLVERAETASKVQSALAELPQRDQKLLECVVIQKNSLRAASSLFNLSHEAIRRRINILKHNLAERLTSHS